jgi:hypothetical protein
LHKPLPKDAKIVDKKQISLIMISAGSLKPSKEVRLNNISFNVVLDPKNNVSFVHTFDKSFRTKNGIRIGDRYGDIKKVLKTGTYEPGFSYYFKSDSDWFISFLDDHILKTGKISDTCKVKMFYKR